MIEQGYSEAMAETLDILNHTRKEDVSKISPQFMEFLKNNASKSYKPNLDHTKRIKEMHLGEKTVGILSVINRKFWCNDNERMEFDIKLKENEKKYQENLKQKYNSDNIFKNSNKQNITVESNMSNEVSMTKYEESVFKKIWNKISNIFRKN